MLRSFKTTAKLIVVLLILFFSAGIFSRSYVVIIPSYNNIKWWRKNIESVLYLETADKINYRVMYIDDCSTDGTGEAVEQYIENWKSKTGSNLDIRIIHNEKRRGAMSNWYRAIHSCRDDEVVVSLDGDDCLAHKQVLLRLEQEYANGIWLTYGQFIKKSNGLLGQNTNLKVNIPIRKQEFVTSHLRTFYAGLFKQIQLKDLLDINNKFYVIACDVALMMPMLEMCGDKYKFISDVLYIYNNENTISDDKINADFQVATGRKIQAKSKYKRTLTHRFDGVSTDDYTILNPDNYKKKIETPYVVIEMLSRSELCCYIAESNLLRLTGVSTILVGNNAKVLFSGELVSSLAINEKNAYTYVVQFSHLDTYNNFKYAVLTNKRYMQVVRRHKIRSFKELKAVLIDDLKKKDQLVLYKII